MLANDPKHFPLVLRSVYVRSSSTRMMDGFDPFIPNQQLTGRFRSENPKMLVRPAGKDEAGKSTPAVCTFLHKFDFAYSLGGPEISAEDESALAAEINATLAVDYVVRGEMPSERVLESWGRSSALIHSWPYWREFCHATLSRMSLPVSMMPMLDVQTIAETEGPGATKKRVASSKAKQ